MTTPAFEPYDHLTNLLELVIPKVLEHYAANVVQLACDCPQCRRDIAAFVLSTLQPLYYGSLTREMVNAPPKIQWRTVSADKVDQQIRRAVAIIGERPHHNRPSAVEGIEIVSPEVVAERIVGQLLDRPLLEQLYGVPVPMCIPCNEVGRRSESKFCDRCGGALVDGLPSISLR